MFTGIIEATSEIVRQEELAGLTTLAIKKPVGWELTVGQSVAVSGACLTVVSSTNDEFVVELMSETLAKTIFKKPDTKKVNLERALPANGRFEGHVVQGHVDTVGKIEAIDRVGETAVWTVTFPVSFGNLVVDKGSVAIDGVSLTIVEARFESLTVALIPHTLNHTTLGERGVGEEVNLEFDILGKYIVKNKLS